MLNQEGTAPSVHGMAKKTGEVAPLGTPAVAQSRPLVGDGAGLTALQLIMTGDGFLAHVPKHVVRHDRQFQ